MDPSDQPPAADAGWHRLDVRMLLVHPVRDLARFLPAVVGVLLFGRSADGGGWWGLVAVGVPIVLGLSRYLTTSYRITAGLVEVRRGLVSRRVLTAPLDRVRTVDLTASPVHRLLGLVTVRVGTGQGGGTREEHLALDGLPAAAAGVLRARLLRLAPEAVSPGTEAASGRRVLVTLDPTWVRFAPLTSTGVVIAGAALGALAQSAHSVTIGSSDDLDRLARLGPLLLVVLGALALLVTICVLAVVGYVLANYGFELSRASADGSWHVRRGLFTTRETSIDDARVSGVTLGEPLALRLARGARLGAIVTGLDKKQRGSAVLVPPAPRREVDRVAGEVLGASSPVSTPLVRHGPGAHRRRWVRAMGPAGVVAVAAVVTAYAVSWAVAGVAPLVLAGGAVLARDRWNGLGHALTQGYLVARSGSLDRRREALRARSIIGWNLRATWFQRRAGLTDLVATTAGGRQRIRVLDLDESAATSLAAQATPSLLEQFLD